MDSAERSRKRAQRWSKRKAVVIHLAVCFVVGALAPLAATGGPFIGGIRASVLPFGGVQRVAPPSPPAAPDIGLLLIVTVTRPDEDGMSQEASVTRLGHTLRHVPPPLVWIVVGAENRSASTVQVLRSTGVMFRHLTYATNITTANNTGNASDEADLQKNVALSHIERHRLAGVVHFAAASAIYDLEFFEELRQTRGVAAWPTATVSSADQTVTLQGPTCNSSQITGWYSKDSSTNATATHTADAVAAQDTGAIRNSSSLPPEIGISGLGFRSSILWESEWFADSNSSSGGGSQDYIQLVRRMAVGDEDVRKGIPSDCSKSRIMMWHLDMPKYTPEVKEQETPREQSLLEEDEEDYMT
ncbi:probable glucuronosyltransferase Os01g0157700 [Triticum dicoccoides]|uniref:probable glucuronosyltransferase Os01g0157700 n=1 Tax=Triticum dicoccoides TaxID=85692 RepID=UPI0018904476|nr:probable glucuronosyltransferase Os01g0157700 [Triticum dicoccoides]